MWEECSFWPSTRLSLWHQPVHGWISDDVARQVLDSSIGLRWKKQGVASTPCPSNNVVLSRNQGGCEVHFR